MDIIYPIDQGSIWNDTELRYSLRSVQKHLTGFSNIWIIGKLPDFVQGVNHIPFDDVQQNKEANIWAKIMRACEESSISQDFLFFNDDHFLLSDFDAKTFPFYYKGTLENLLARNRRGIYYRAVSRTYHILRSQNKTTFHFDTHCPIVYNKDLFKQVTQHHDWNTKIGLIIKSLYCNTLAIEGIREPDCKINKLCLASEINQIIESRKFFSIGNRAINDQLKIVLDTLYPTPSRWEKEL